jgi:type IX secretion system PorP/SprF family membrane protein
MKKSIFILTGLLAGMTLYSQQIPLSETYFLDKYSLSPSYAGNFNSKYLFTGYRSDWTGIDGGPKTIRLTYNDILMSNAGFGGKLIYDKAGIFRQFYLMGSYSYRLEVADKHYVLFGLSAGLYRNTINMSDFYNDPKYTLDPSLINQDVKSKVKFMSDFSAVYLYKGLETGIMFSNINFGDASYSDVNARYKPMANFQCHASYTYGISENWDLAPLIILRGGKYIRSQFEIASLVTYREKIWGSLAFRDPGVWGAGIGTDIDRGIKIAYNFNFASNVGLGIFNNHEFAVGINIFEYTGKRK